MLLFLVTVWLLIQSPFVQTWVVTRVAGKLSANLHTTVRVKHVDFSLFNRMSLEDALVEDAGGDTLLYAGRINVRITDWWFFKDHTDLHYLGLDDATIKLQRKDSIWNYQFLVDYFSSPEKASLNKDSAKGLTLSLKAMEFSHIHFLKKDQWRGEDMDLHLGHMTLDAERIDLTHKIARIRTLAFAEPVFSIANYPGRRPSPPDTPQTYINDPLHLRLNPAGWDITAADVAIRNGSFLDDKRTDTHLNKSFDGSHIHFYAISLNAREARLQKDTVTAQLTLSTRERSGFVVKKLSSRIKWYPEAMEFAKLDIQTGKSHIRNFFTMRFKSFDDMDDFTTKVSMEADFADADVDSDDIGFFAPDLKEWKKHIRITGHIQGPVADLFGRKIVLQAGKNTSLNGDIHLTGLPDIDKTHIDFSSNDFKTTYGDMVTLLPVLRHVDQPRIDRIEFLRFQGDFKGSIHRFQSNGHLQTNLGNLTTNVDMQIEKNDPALYSGDIVLDHFDLGQFLDNDQLGKISFQGKIHGIGLKPATVNAKLDGNVQNLEFSGYTYSNIQVNGAVAHKKFNGHLVAADSNLVASLDGLVDFSQDQPKFDFYATVDKADLTQLRMVENQQVRFNGKFRFNFTGSNIDNFLGSARVYDASVFKNGQRISFDSLTIESSIVDSNKTITVVSNEFDGAIVGEFSIHDLPSSFQTFLNKYYPSYIKPIKVKPANENFSFVITTKKVDDYVDFFNKDLKGFNNAGISGRIDTHDNLLDLNVELPAFNYKQISFNNLALKGRGNLDSLSMETTIGEVYVSDSLHFPGTHIRLNSSDDLSEVQIKTSANQTLNSANLSARVQTSRTGVHIVFDPSTFDINSKTWVIDKDGELAVDNNIISADHLKFSSGDQEIRITTHPSSEGNWNDMHVDLKKINMGDFTPYVVKTERIEGLLSGSADIYNPFGKYDAHFTGNAEQFRFDNDSIGRLSLDAGYRRSSGTLKALVHSDNKNYRFDLKGEFNADSTLGPAINISANLAETRVDILQKYLDGIFGNLKGMASGQLQVIGPSDRLLYLGTLQLRDASLRVLYTQCDYTIPAATIRFKKDTVDFGTLTLKDKFGHTADLTRGRLFHHAFNDLGFDFELNTNRLLLLDTKATDNNQFYGTVIGKARLTMTGPESNMQMYIKGEPTDSSNIYLPPSISRESGDADFIVWKVYGEEMKTREGDKKGSNLLVTMDITANNYANIYMILDPLSGDVIKTNGHGAINMKVGTTQDLAINGHYDIDRGLYNFTLQSVFHRPFVLSEGVGNFIQWSGDPYDATIGIEAVYTAENVRFSDLGLSAVNGLGVQSENVKRYRGNIIVTADLTGKLTAPDIVFHIDLPPGSPLKNDQDAQALLQKIQDDPNELNKQVSCLVILNSFVPLSNSTNAFDPTTAVTGVVVGSISGALGTAISKRVDEKLKKIDPSLSVNFNTTLYNGSNLVDNIDQSRYSPDRTNLNLSIGKSFLKEKLTLTFGSAFDIGITPQQAQASSFQFLPDVTAEYKITPDGHIVVTFFYRDSYNYLSSTNHTQNSSGSSISYRRDFDRIDELFRGKKKKKKETPPPAPPQQATNTDNTGTTTKS